MDVKTVINERGWTIECVASEKGIFRVTHSQNLSRNPTVNTLKRIVSVIDCKVGDFFQEQIEVPTLINSCSHCGKPIIE